MHAPSNWKAKINRADLLRFMVLGVTLQGPDPQISPKTSLGLGLGFPEKKPICTEPRSLADTLWVWSSHIITKLWQRNFKLIISIVSPGLILIISKELIEMHLALKFQSHTMISHNPLPPGLRQIPN